MRDLSYIEALFKSFEDSWNRADADRMVDLCTEDATLVDPTGGSACGKDQIRRHLMAILSGIMQGTESLLRVDKVHFLTPTVAMVDATHIIAGMKAKDGTELPQVENHVVASLLKQLNKWRFVDIRPYGFLPAQ